MRKVFRGVLVAFQGLDKTGKTTQSKILSRSLSSPPHNIPSHVLHFPVRSGSFTGKLLDSYLKDSTINLPVEASHLIFSANRWELNPFMKQYLDSTQDKPKVLIVDRYSWSGIAYSRAQGIDRNWASKPDMGLCQPDLLIYMVDRSGLSSTRQGYGLQRYQKDHFQRQVSNQYDRLVQENKEKTRIIQIDSKEDRERNSKKILEEVLGIYTLKSST